jgi:hypothetical protein
MTSRVPLSGRELASFGFLRVKRLSLLKELVLRGDFANALGAGKLVVLSVGELTFAKVALLTHELAFSFQRSCRVPIGAGSVRALRAAAELTVVAHNE